MSRYAFMEHRFVIGGELNVEHVECDCCQAEVPLCVFYRTTIARRDVTPKWLLCEVCAGSYISNHQDYANQYEHCRDATQAMAYCTNQVLLQLGKFKGVETKPVPSGWSTGWKEETA